MHALASAAIPILFPAINLHGAYYCDGGLRQNTPLSPALRLGANRVLVISLSSGKGGDVPMPQEGTQEPYPGPFLLLGKVLNALMLDHLDYDLGRLHGLNQLLRDGTAAFGPQFVEHLAQTTELMRGASYREVIPTVIRPSRDLGEIANEWVQMGASGLSGLAGFILRQIAQSDRNNHSDLLSYLCFDGRLAESLIQLGMADADAMRERLIAFFSE
jgi:NTE family protein